jgi:type 1 glutamine amidotransferase
MKHYFLHKLFLFVFVLFLALTGTSANAQKIKTLIITGQNNHNWQVSHVALKQILQNSDLFSVDLAVSPERGKDMSRFIVDFKPYQLVVIDYNGDNWPQQTNKAFLDFVRNGGGVVIYHAANNTFPEWKEYNEITALGGWGNRNEKSGPYLYWKDGKIVKDTSPGSGGAHGNAHEFILTARNGMHPVVKGLPGEWKHAKDELYEKMRGPGNIADLLYTAYADPATKGSGREEPLLFTINYGKGRIFHTMLGHAGKTLQDNIAMQCAGFQVTLLRGSEWAATGKVTQAVPSDFPKKNAVSLRPAYRSSGPAPMKPDMSEYWAPQPAIVTPGVPTAQAACTAPSDALVLFDGKDLSEWKAANGGEAKWYVHDGVFTVNKKAGDILTKKEFEDFQLHIEWCVPGNITGESQARGNSGVFLQDKYEVQILDSYNNLTYVNGQSGSIYKQNPPLVNAMRKPGEWNVYDIIYKAPAFNKDGKYRTPPVVTVLHNGVLIQNGTIVLGTTEYVGFPKVTPHGKGPLRLQSHGDPSEPISFRNIWIREL